MAERTRVLKSGQSMAPGDRLLSRKNAQGQSEYRLDYQVDGNLVLYDVGGKPLWATDEWIPGGKVMMDRRLSFTVRNQIGRIWPEPAFAHPEGSRLVLHDDGNLVVYGDPTDRRRHQITFRSATSGSPSGELVLHDDGNAVIYDASGKALWDSVTKFLPL